MAEIRIMQGDNIELLKGFTDNSIDSIVTDCPYGLGKEPNAVELIQAWATAGYLEIKGKGFMGKSWDAFVPQPLFWKEAFRVLKPGGHVAAFFGTRTYDWGTLAIRLAGFEIRDMICWHYGSGFPKSLDVSKAIDKHHETKRPTETKSVGDINNSRFAAKGDSPRVIKEVANNIPISQDALKYNGFGTALKPATEPICIARKPLSGTVAQNVLQHGTGGLNLDSCRIGTEGSRNNGRKEGTKGIYGNIGATTPVDYDQGRFPANVILDEYMAAKIDLQSGELTSGGGRKGENGKRNYVKNASSNSLSCDRSDTKEKFWDEEAQDWYSLGKVWADTGGASRFFYCAKSSTSERNAGCENLLDVSGGFKNASGRGLSAGDNYKDIIVKNNHPTVKPISLMRWLIRLITPKGGICLDPFAGSGTTGCAAAFEGVEIILMEMEPEYIPIIEARTKYWQKKANRELYEKELLSAVQTLF